MKLFKVIGHVLAISAEVAAAVAADGDEGRKVSPREAASLSGKIVDFLLDVAPAVDTAARKGIAAALRTAADRLEASL